MVIFARHAAGRPLPDSRHRQERAHDALGVVDNAADRQIAEIRAREVTGVFGVENGLQISR